MRRIFLLLEWDPDLGAAADLVGVLGIEDGRDALAEWIPWHPDLARWYQRVREGVDTRRVATWLDEDATLAIAEVTKHAPDLDLRTAVAAALDAQLAAPSAPGWG